jgi:gamma-glutamylcyclotransferase (GGCT)/AIG2-like uncharacterized protein YtfP
VLERVSHLVLSTVGWERPLGYVDSPCNHLLFVYGTLKRGFHWNNKFLSTAFFVCSATTTSAWPLVVGESGVPYLLSRDQVPPSTENDWHRVRGEVWRVSDEALVGLDEYEGVSKGDFYLQFRNVLMSLLRVLRAGQGGSRGRLWGFIAGRRVHQERREPSATKRTISR